MTADPYELLRAESEPTPDWLMAHAANQPFPRQAFFSSRVIYYPGSAADGHPLKLFGGTHAAHCFVFVDCGLSKDFFEEQLADSEHAGHPRGYRALAVAALQESDLAPNGWKQHVSPALPTGVQQARPPGGAFALFAVLERNAEFGDDHGPSRLAILVVGGDGMATYDALFCQADSGLAPFAIVLQDHGSGGNWSAFGGRSVLWRLALARLPPWLLVADNTKAWPGYDSASTADNGGMHSHPRRLFHRPPNHLA